MIHLLRAILLCGFIASVAVMVILRSPGQATVIEDGRYFVRYKQLRYEITRAQYEENKKLMWRARWSRNAMLTMFLSLFCFIGIESVRMRQRRRPARPKAARAARR